MIIEDKLHIQNKTKGYVYVSSAAYGYEPHVSFILIFNDIDAKTCRELAISECGSDISTGFLALSIKNDGDLTVDRSGLTTSEVVSADNVILAYEIVGGTLEQVYNLCNRQTVDNCTIAWKFY